MAVSAIHAVSVDHKQRNIRFAQCLTQLEHTAGRLFAAPVAEIDDTVRTHVLCQLCDHGRLAFVRTIVEVIEHLGRQRLKRMVGIQRFHIVEVHFRNLDLIVFSKIKIML